MDVENKPKKKGKKKHVQFKVQESEDVDQAMKLFLVFEGGDSGVLSFSEFNEANQKVCVFRLLWHLI